MAPTCSRCDRSFESVRAFAQHVAASGRHHVCNECQKDFASEQGLRDHGRVKHLSCKPCGRVFQNGHDLAVHTRSSIHQPRVLGCPAMHCTRRFVSLGAFLSHMESGGACATAFKLAQTAGGVSQWLNHLMVFTAPVDQVSSNIICELDDHNRSRSPSAFVLGDDDDGSLSDSDASGTLSSGSRIMLIRAKCATELSWNGTKYECVLCHKTFVSLPALNAHLDASRAHKAKVYRCSRARGYDGCRKKFTSLKSVVRHVEEEQCGSVKRFRKQLNEPSE